MRQSLDLITAESINRPEVSRWHRRIKNRYNPPEGIALTVVLPCSAKKPYSTSRSHMAFKRAIKKGSRGKRALVHEVILTSPLGLVPRELETIFPASWYDVPVTGHWSPEEKEIARKLLANYMKKAGTRVMAHVDGAYKEICGSLGIPTTVNPIMSEEGLKELEDSVRKNLEEFEKGVKNEYPLISLRKVADYQFGPGAGELLFPQGTKARRIQIFYNKKQIATISPKTGLFSLSMEGGSRLKSHKRYHVELNFIPTTNSVFVVGIESADKDIRPGDEVIATFMGDVVGVGKSVLSGTEMTRAHKGLGISLRHRK